MVASKFAAVTFFLGVSEGGGLRGDNKVSSFIGVGSSSRPTGLFEVDSRIGLG